MEQGNAHEEDKQQGGSGEREEGKWEGGETVTTDGAKSAVIGGLKSEKKKRMGVGWSGDEWHRVVTWLPSGRAHAVHWRCDHA